MNEGTREDVSLGRRHIIERPRLTRLLDECEARVILLVAPAGYGKTTLAREWMSPEPRRGLWCHLTQNASDVALLAQLLGSSLEPILPGALSRLQTRLATSMDPETQASDLARVLSGEIVTWPDNSWLVVDDYHAAFGDSVDRFFEDFVSQATVQMVLTTRQRPKWATARRLMYGEIYQLSAAALAMTHDEAFEVLGSRGSSSRGFFALADGWPAVIGLAAVAGPSLLAAERAPNDLYEFLADEVFSAISRASQRALCILALLPSLDDEPVNAILPESDHATSEAVHAGLLTRRDAGFDLHPLLRVFLTRKLRDEYGVGFGALAGDVGQALIGSGRWDDALSIAVEHGQIALLEDALEHGLETMLREGRLESILRVIDTARRFGRPSGIIDLAAAEVALRQGHASSARSLAESALTRLDVTDRRRSSALIVLGRSAHQSDEYVLGFEAFREARAASTTDAETREALWGMFLCACQLDRDDATAVLDEFAARATEDADSAIRVGIGRQVDAERLGGFGSVVDATEPLVDLLPFARNPLVRLSFLSGRARLLADLSRYDDALHLLDESQDAIRADELTFALPIMYATEGMAAAGKRQFRRALTLLRKCESAARDLGDLHNVIDAMAIRCRLLLSIGRPEEAISSTPTDWDRKPSPTMWAELLASIALAFACTGRRLEMERFLAESDETAQIARVRVLRALASAILAVRLETGEVAKASSEALEHVLQTDHYDSFVVAYRAEPRLLTPLVASARGSLERFYAQVPDPELGRALGLPIGRSAERQGFTPRESEVYAFLSAGLTNREIAERLFISDVTVKVHVRHILAKLGVRSRVEAVLASTELTPPP